MTFSAETIDHVARFVAPALNPKSSWFDTLRDITNPNTIEGGAKRQALKSWAREGDVIDTLQVIVSVEDFENVKVTRTWEPGNRTVVKVGASYITWDTKSLLDYKGTLSLRASDNIWLGGFQYGPGHVALMVLRKH